MGVWGLGLRSKGLLPTDSLRRRGSGTDGVGSGAGTVRVNC